MLPKTVTQDLKIRRAINNLPMVLRKSDPLVLMLFAQDP